MGVTARHHPVRDRSPYTSRVAAPTPSPLERLSVGLGEGLAYGTVLLGADLCVEWVSPSAHHLVGYSPEELVGRPALDLVHPDDVAPLAAIAFAEVASPNPFGRGDPAGMATNLIRVRHADGSWRALDLAANNQLANPDVAGIVLVLRDATAEQALQEVLLRLSRNEPLPSVVGAVVDLLAAQIEGVAVSVRARDGGGAPVTVARGVAPEREADVSVPLEHEDFRSELRVWVPGGDPTLWCRTLVDRAAGLVRLAQARDVGLAELRRAAQTDPLTGVRNRAGLADRLDTLAAGAWGGLNAVLYVDLDGFKRVNDEWGHATGDAVLVEVARRLQGCLRSGDVLSRTGGDEFVAVCAGVPDAAVAAAIAHRIVGALNRPVVVPAGEVACGATVGVAVGGRDDTPQLTERADAALLRAKRAGKGRVEIDAR